MNLFAVDEIGPLDEMSEPTGGKGGNGYGGGASLEVHLAFVFHLLVPGIYSMSYSLPTVQLLDSPLPAQLLFGGARSNRRLVLPEGSFFCYYRVHS